MKMHRADIKKSPLALAGFIEGVALGGFVSCEFFLIIFGQLDILTESQNTTTIYAALIGSSAALLAAYLALRGVRAQIQSNIEVENERNRKEQMVARAMLPLALTEISHVCRNNIEQHFPQDALPLNHKKGVGFVSFDVKIFENIQASIRHCPDEVSERLSKIISIYQVLSARSRGEDYKEIRNDDKEINYAELKSIPNAINWAVIHSIADTLYDFARGKEGYAISKVDGATVRRAFFSAGIVIEDWPAIKKIIDSREEKNVLEMNFERE